MNQLLKIAAVQCDVAIGRPDANLEAMAGLASEAAAQGAQLVVFPECVVTGYCFDSVAEARAFAEPVPGPATQRLYEVCSKLGLYIVAGLLERDGERLYNACVLVGPGGLVGSYRKLHLPYLGVDRFATPGDRPPSVWEIATAAGPLRLGMNICYDASFPESARVMALAGADLVVLPTNWPPGAQCTAEHVLNTRALENHIYYLAANRVGHERGFTFIGRSRICDPHGGTLQAAGTEPCTLCAEIDPQLARNKHIVRVPGKHEIHRFRDRRPEMYGLIVQPRQE